MNYQMQHPGRFTRGVARGETIQDFIQDSGRHRPSQTDTNHDIGRTKHLVDGIKWHWPNAPGSTHNPLVVGSIPTRPTRSEAISEKWNGRLVGRGGPGQRGMWEIRRCGVPDVVG